MRYDLEGELAQPDPRVTWDCPSCRRVEVTEERGPVSFRACAGDPITGAAHPPAAMLRTPPATSARLVHTSTPADPTEPSLAERWRQVVPRQEWRVLDLTELEEFVPLTSRPDYCLTCGPLVVVDNPVRREVRHRRGCPTQEA